MTTKSTKPTHRVYAVTRSKTKDGKGYWTEIGAAFPHADNKGFRLALRAIPVGDQDIVVREITATDAPAQEVGFA